LDKTIITDTLGCKCSRDPSHCPKCAGHGSIEVDKLSSRGVKCEFCNGTGNVTDFHNCSNLDVFRRHKTEEACLASTRFTEKDKDVFKCEWITCKEAEETDDFKCSVCDADWDRSWNAIGLQTADLVLAAAAYKYNVDHKQIKQFALAMTELASNPNMENLLGLCKKGGELVADTLMNNQKSELLNFLGNDFAKKIKPYIGQFATGKLRQFAEAKCREKMGMGFTKNPATGTNIAATVTKKYQEFLSPAKSRRRRMLSSRLRQEEYSDCFPPFTALALAIEEEGFNFCYL